MTADAVAGRLLQISALPLLCVPAVLLCIVYQQDALLSLISVRSTVNINTTVLYR